MKEVIISNLAKKENANNTDYIFSEFGIDITLKYLDKFDEVISLLETGFYTGIYEKKFNFYKILVVKQIYILYENLDDNTILIFSVWNNKKLPYWF